MMICIIDNHTLKIFSKYKSCERKLLSEIKLSLLLVSYSTEITLVINRFHLFPNKNHWQYHFLYYDFSIPCFIKFNLKWDDGVIILWYYIFCGHSSNLYFFNKLLWSMNTMREVRTNFGAFRYFSPSAIVYTYQVFLLHSSFLRSLKKVLSSIEFDYKWGWRVMRWCDDGDWDVDERNTEYYLLYLELIEECGNINDKK